jgi:hypothetical protein
MKDEKIDRLLRSAARAREETAATMPFGFDTRVVALWRAAAQRTNGVTSLVRRVAVLSAAVIIISEPSVKLVKTAKSVNLLRTNSLSQTRRSKMSL